MVLFALERDAALEALELGHARRCGFSIAVRRNRRHWADIRSVRRGIDSRQRGVVVVDPRSAIGDFVWSWMVGGFKGMRYVVSADYRSRVHAFWRLHPDRRAGGVRRMILGAMLDVFIVACVGLVIASHR